VVPGRYPEPGVSVLCRRKGQAMEMDNENLKALPAALVSSAIWTDLTGDGWPELALACEWGPLVILRNNHGKLSPWNPPVVWDQSAPPGDLAKPSLDHRASTLDKLTGWWNGIAAGDFDNDGRLDLVAANWGGNTQHQHWCPAPIRVYFGDLNGTGGISLLETHYVHELRQFAPERMLDVVLRGIPRLGERFSTHAAWARAGIDEVLADSRSRARHHEAVWLESTLFLNREDHFVARVLPAPAQFAPAFAVCIADADGDGNEDVFMSQNFFAVGPDASRSDAGRGLWLRGDGHGHLSAVRGQDCGVLVYGEQRGAALSDFDGDGRVDLVVSQNRAETRLFRNLGARPGLRVRLQGPEGNPYGVGATVRLRYGADLGAAREVRAGNGYWSQDSATLVLGTPSPPTAIRVRWPGGRVTESQLPRGAREVRVRSNGEIEGSLP